MEKVTDIDERYRTLTESLFKRFPSFQNAGRDAYKPGLERVEFLDGLLGRPHRRYRTVHVAGTNGKGSVSNMLASALAARGQSVGLYTSPHLLDFRERMRIVRDGDEPELISKEEVVAFVERWSDSFDHLDLSFFEITTMMAFDWFAARGVDVAVIETGLGGRLDTTNIITPEISVITNIGLDHCDLLGSTLGEIAFEKAGIIKPGVPAVVGESNPETDFVFENKVLYSNMSAARFPGDRSVVTKLLTFADRVAERPGESVLLGRMDLRGSYQKHNLRTVLAALSVLDGAPVFLDGTLSDALARTAARTGFHGRWERICENPEVICDIGHNAHGLKYNFSQLEASGRPLVIVYGSVADKDVDAVLKLIPVSATLVFTAADSHRAMPADEVMRRFLSIRPELSGSGRVFCVPGVADAVRTALELTKSISSCKSAETALPLMYVGGSTYVVAEAVPLLR